MVDVIDVDRFFQKSDFEIYFNNKLKFPWPVTHFILQKQCFYCGAKIKNAIIYHFALVMKSDDVKMLLESSFFWCKNCNYAIYDHYPEDECFCSI